GTGSVSTPDFHADRAPVAEEHAIADPAMDGVIGEAVRRVLLEVEARVAAQEIEEIPGATEVQDQTGAAGRERGGGVADGGVGALIAPLELGADHVGEEISEPSAAAELIVQGEGVIVPRVRSEGTELDLVRALRAEARGPPRERDSQHHQCPHRSASQVQDVALR